MPVYLISLSFFALAALGIYGAILAIRIGKKIFNAPIYLELPFLAQRGSFTLNKSGNYSVWHKGRQLMRAPVDKYRPVIRNLDTNQIVRLSPSILRTHKNDMSFNASMELFNFRAEAGNYELELVDGSSISNFERVVSSPFTALATNFDPSKYFILVKKYTNPLLIFAFVWLIILSFSTIVCGLVFGFGATHFFGN